MKIQVLILLLFNQLVYAQVGIGTTIPNTSSALDIVSTNTGILIPRMTQAQRVAITSPATGLLVYQTDITTGFWYYDSSSWIPLDKTASWDLAGNSGTNATTNFIGTTDDVDLVFKRNNTQSGLIATNSTSFGLLALNPLSTGVDNTAFGDSALASNLGGLENTAVGTESMESNTTGGRNTAIGRRALRRNTTAFNNTAIGYQAMRGIASITGGSNTAVGQQALIDITSGAANVAIGVRSLDKNSTGSSNVAVGGLDCLGSNTTGNFNVSIGVNSMFNSSVGNENTAVGQTSLYNNTLGSSNTAFGHAALFGTTTGNYNIGIGVNCGNIITTGSNNIAIGNLASVPSGTASNQVRIGNTSISYAGIQVGWTTTSDIHWKNNVRKLRYGLDFLVQLNPVDYLRIGAEDKGLEMGFIAQEVANTLSKLGYHNQGFLTKDHEGYYGIRYNDFIPLIVKGIQEQQLIIENQKAEIDELKTRLSKIETFLDQTN